MPKVNGLSESLRGRKESGSGKNQRSRGERETIFGDSARSTEQSLGSAPNKLKTFRLRHCGLPWLAQAQSVTRSPVVGSRPQSLTKGFRLKTRPTAMMAMQTPRMVNVTRNSTECLSDACWRRNSPSFWIVTETVEKSKPIGFGVFFNLRQR